MLSDIASIATLILFIIYFIGRTITIFAEKSICYDEITFESEEDARNKYNIVDGIDTDGTFHPASEMPTMVVLTSRQGVRKIKVSTICYDDELNEISANNTVIGEYEFLNIGESFAIRTYIPELLPRYRIEYQTQDFKKVTLNISDNLKSGVVSEMLVPTHTVKSVLYYLFR